MTQSDQGTLEQKQAFLRAQIPEDKYEDFY